MLFGLNFILAVSANSKNQPDPNEQLNMLFERYDEFNYWNNPISATYDGYHKWDDRVDDWSERAFNAYYDTIRTYDKELLSIDYKSLSSDNKLNYDLFKTSLEQILAGERFKWYYTPITQQWGIHIDFPQIVNIQPTSTFEEYQKYFKRLKGFHQMVTDIIVNIRKGIKLGLLPPDFIIEQTLPQMESIMNVEPEKSVFYSPFKKKNKLTPKEKELVSEELKDIISNSINPAYKKFYEFVKNEYLPVCRKDAGLWALPDGKERYENEIKNYTTLDLTADEIHNIGLKEVERIQGEMEKLKVQIGFKGTLDEFNTFLKTDPQFYYTDKQDLMDGFRTILSKMDSKLPDLFGRLPEAKYDLFEMEEYRAKSAPTAYYYSAPEDRSRPGYFYVNTYSLPSRPKYTMTALALHEAVPGHHLQISIAQELKNLPKFRRNLGVTAFVEGWGLYAEFLGYETGMYEDLYQRYGALTYEMWRACRLVMDTGIHEKRWTREQAYDFMKKYTANSDQDIRSEVDRYISWPGQALAYKLGEMKIKELRKMAEEKLGSRFNVKEFHDNILKNGAIPLSLLEQKINDWVASKLN